MAIGLRKLHGAVIVAVLWRPSFALALETEPIRIEYRADPDARCPSPTDFAQQVFARTGAARPASPSEPARTFVVELKRTGARVVGTLAIEETKGSSMARHVSGSECGDVASVLALAVALAIDPRAELAPRQQLEPVRPPPKPSPDTPPPKLVPGAQSPARRQRAQEASWSPGALLGASAAFGIAPHPSFGPTAGVSLRQHHAALLRELGLALAYRSGAPELIRGARADFRFLTSRATLCARGIELAKSLYASPCFVFEAGAVTASGSDLPVTARETRFWAATEGVVQLEHALPAGFFMTLDGGAVIPLTRYRFVFRSPETSVHEVPQLAAQLGSRLGLAF
jgi:hypothetical protein